MQVKTAETSNAKWIRNSMKAYLEGSKGSKDLKWIVGIIIAGGDVAGAKEVLITLQNYGDRKRYQELSNWFLSQT
jgi:hypothetical protein